MPSSKVFIAWGGTKGKRIGERLHRALKQRKIRAFISSKDMKWGEPDWEAKLRQTIQTCDAFILVCTRSACCSKEVVKEIGWAKKVGLIMPLKVDREPLHPLVLLPNAHPFNSRNPDYDSCREELIRGIKNFRRKVNEAKRPTIVPADTVGTSA